jgi:hypothetical protein
MSTVLAQAGAEFFEKKKKMQEEEEKKKNKTALAIAGAKIAKKAAAAKGASGSGGGEPVAGSGEKRLSLINSYCRIKPLSADKAGGKDSDKQITGWDEEAGTVELGGTVYGHARRTLPPDATQVHVYEVICQPLVRSWLEGYDADLLSYGQTGAGKTFTMFGPPYAMAAAAKALGGGGSGIAADGILVDDHGFILRSGFEALAAVESINQSGRRAVLHGSMVEMTILTLSDQSVIDLLNGRAKCFVDKQHHLQGALLLPLKNGADLVNMAAAVETRLTRGTKMNDTSSRSHCMTVFTLSVLDGETVRESRLQFFDLMGSERFKGANAAHDSTQSSKSTASGFEGIYANLSLSSLMNQVEAAAKARRSNSKKKHHNAMLKFCLTDLLQGSLMGSATTAMVTCLSQAARNGDESCLSLKYGASMSQLMTSPKPQPVFPIQKLLENAKKQYETSAAVVKRGVAGKYQALRQAEVTQWAQTVQVLAALAGE